MVEVHTDGELTVFHRRLDEFAEIPRSVLEVLRQPLEDGHVCVSRAAAAYDFPSKFMLVAAMNHARAAIAAIRVANAAARCAMS